MNVVNLDYRDFIKEAMKQDSLSFIEPTPSRADQDWRNVAINKALEYSDSEWIWFTEQDFFIENPKEFWKGIDNLMENFDSIIYNEGERPHPCCWFVKREFIDKTSKDFGVIPDKSDHFGKFYEELNSICRIVHLVENDSMYHMNGLSQNMHMLQSGDEPNFRPEEFQEYLKDCLKIKLPLHPDFVKLANAYIG